MYSEKDGTQYMKFSYAMILVGVALICCMLLIFAIVTREKDDAPLIVATYGPSRSEQPVQFPEGTTDWRALVYANVSPDYFCEIGGKWYRCSPVFPPK